MALRFFKCVAVVTFVHVLAAALVLGAYVATRAGSGASRPGPGQPFTLVAKDPVLVHEVQSGDSYQSVARAYGVTVQALLDANSRSASQAPRAGDRLVIPGRD